VDTAKPLRRIANGKKKQSLPLPPERVHLAKIAEIKRLAKRV
jgi:hypothetical protein